MKKITFFLLLLLGFGAVAAQTVTTKANFSCPGYVTVTYDLVSNDPVDVTLYYSRDKCTWLLAQTVTGDLLAQTTGTGKTITWNNYTDNVRFGKFFFKVEGPCVMINSICWATRNLDVGGGFCANPEDYGALYQWGRQSDGHESPTSGTAVGPVSVLDLNGQVPVGDPAYGKFIIDATPPYDWRTPQNDHLWNAGTDSSPIKTVNDPCPSGWRTPTQVELESLGQTTFVTSVWTTENGIDGRRFTDIATGNDIFLPAAGTRDIFSGGLYGGGMYGYYWSSNVDTDNAFYMEFNSGNMYYGSMPRTSSYCVRCVLDK